MYKHKLIGLDLAKSVIQVGVEDRKHRKIELNRSMTVARLKRYLANHPPAIVAMEACGTAHWWCWFAQDHGHEVILLPPRHVAAYRQGHKTDETDVLAVLEAAKRPNRKESVKKTPEMLALQMLLKTRQHYVDHKRGLSNQLRGHLLEFGFRIPQGYAALKRAVMPLLADADNDLPDLARSLADRLYGSFLAAEQGLQEMDRELAQRVKAIEPCRRLMQLEGVGPVVALLLYVQIGDGSAFKNGREAAAWIGVTPQQHSTGGVARIGHIRKQHVDKQTRAILLQGAKSVVYQKITGSGRKSLWLQQLIQRRGENIAAVALVNKNIRTAWALLSRGEAYVAA